MDLGDFLTLLRNHVPLASATQVGIHDDRLAQAGRLKTLDYDAVLQNMVVYGTPEDVTERRHKLQEALGINQLVYEVNFGCRVPLELQINSACLRNERLAPNFD